MIFKNYVDDLLEHAFQKFGSYAGISRALGVRPATISQWFRGSTPNKLNMERLEALYQQEDHTEIKS